MANFNGSKPLIKLQLCQTYISLGLGTWRNTVVIFSILHGLKSRSYWYSKHWHRVQLFSVTCNHIDPDFLRLNSLIPLNFHFGSLICGKNHMHLENICARFFLFWTYNMGQICSVYRQQWYVTEHMVGLVQ